MAPRPEKSADYPKMVYTAGLEDHVIINSAEECPEGYYEHAVAKDMDAEASEPEPSVDENEAELKAAQAEREAKKAQKAHRKAIMAYLDEHSVDYARNMSTDKLEELKVALDEHLAQQDQKDDAE